MVQLSVGSSPNTNFALRNLVAVAPGTFPAGTKYLCCFGGGRTYYFSVEESPDIKPGTIGLTASQRTWARFAQKDIVDCEPHRFEVDSYLGSMTLQLEFQKKKFTSKERYDTVNMAKDFTAVFNNQVFNDSQDFNFEFNQEGAVTFKITVKEMSGLAAASVKEGAGAGGARVACGIITAQTKLEFCVAEGATVSLGGRAMAGGGGNQKSLFDPGWKFDDMGIGGLGAQFSTLFRRAFVSRIFPPEVVEKLGIPHTKGMMLYGPPGTGKTLMARQIGKMLNGVEPKVVNGPEIMSKYVGESEENVRKLFEDAEKEQNERGENSGLHIIIFDEIDAICKQRGTTGGGTGVADSVVNQLLSKIDGVDSLNNVLLIGMTNRLDMIDEALLRPGRFEMKLQIGLPDEKGRLEILNIHTKKLRQVDEKTKRAFMKPDVDLTEIAALTKNFSGAELAGLIRSAVSFATERCVDTSSGSVEIDQKAMDSLQVGREEFMRALTEVKAAFGADDDQFKGTCANGIVSWDVQIDMVLETGKLLASQADNSERTPLVSCLLSGGHGSGKTALASRLAEASGFAYMKLISPENLVGQSENAKIARITKIFEDAYKSPRSVIVVDDIERLIDYVEIGHRFSNAVLQVLLVLFKKRPPQGHRLLVIATTTQYEILRKMGVVAQFSKVQHLNQLESKTAVLKVLADLGGFDSAFTAAVMAGMGEHEIGYQSFDSVPLSVGIKKVYAMAEMSRQADDMADTFLYSLYEECKQNQPF